MSARARLERSCGPQTPAELLRDLDAHAAEVRAATLREAADLLRDLHFGKGYSVQEIGTALRHMADEATP